MTAEVRETFHHREARRSYVPLYASFVADFIQVIGRDARFELCGGDVQYFSSQSADFAHCSLPLSV